MPADKKIFIPPTLRDRGGDLEKDWFVEYSYLNPIDNKTTRKRIYKGLAVVGKTDDNTRALRLKAASIIIDALTSKIKQGWSPLSEIEKEYIDNLEYKSVADTYGRLKKSKRTVRNALSLFLDHKKNSIKPKTFQSYRSKLRKLMNWCESNKLGDVDVSVINDKHIKDFFVAICAQGLDKRTVLKYRQNLYAFFRWCVAEGMMVNNPVSVEVMIPSKKTDMASRPILQHDLEILLDTIEYNDPQLYLASMFQYYTAIRPGTELRLLKIKDIDLYKGSITVNDVDAKEARHETVDMPVQLKNMCIERFLLHTFNPEFYIFGRNRTPGPEPLGTNTLSNRFNAFRDALRMPSHYKFYSFKHTGAGRLLESGATIIELKNHLRHKSIEDTQFYIEKHFGFRNKKVINGFPDPYIKKAGLENKPGEPIKH